MSVPPRIFQRLLDHFVKERLIHQAEMHVAARELGGISVRQFRAQYDNEIRTEFGIISDQVAIKSTVMHSVANMIAKILSGVRIIDGKSVCEDEEEHDARQSLEVQLPDTERREPQPSPASFDDGSVTDYLLGRLVSKSDID